MTEAVLLDQIMGLPTSELIEILEARIERDTDLGRALVSSRCTAHMEVAHIGMVINRFKIDTVIDCGANTGQYSAGLIGYSNFSGEIIAFEPVKRFYDQLCTTFDYWKNQVTLTAVNAAVGEVPGKAMINVGAGHGGTSSLLQQTEALKLVAAGSTLSGEVQEVDVYRIDEYFKDLDFTNRRVKLKMDVQGFEGSVLRSCGDMLQKFTLIQAELGGVEMYQGSMQSSELFTMMEGNGFVPICFFNNFGPADRSMFYDFDVIFARADEVVAVGT